MKVLEEQIFPVALCPPQVLQKPEGDQMQTSVVEVQQLTWFLMKCYSVTLLIAEIIYVL
jgi:hypothetical protein